MPVVHIAYGGHYDIGFGYTGLLDYEGSNRRALVVTVAYFHNDFVSARGSRPAYRLPLPVNILIVAEPHIKVAYGLRAHHWLLLYACVRHFEHDKLYGRRSLLYNYRHIGNLYGGVILVKRLEDYRNGVVIARGQIVPVGFLKPELAYYGLAVLIYGLAVFFAHYRAEVQYLGVIKLLPVIDAGKDGLFG